MSSPSKSLTSSDITPGRVGRYIVPAQSIQSAISTYQHEPTIKSTARGNKIATLPMELQAAFDSYLKGTISGEEYDAVSARIMDVSRAYSRRMVDYRAREQAGQTKPGDYCKEFYGYTDQEAEEYLHEFNRVADIRHANEALSQHRIMHKSGSGRGH